MRETLRRTRFAWAVGLAALTWSGGARADAVGPGPAECPDGATPDACHGAEYCNPTICTNDTACAGGKVCRSVAMCILMDTCFGGDSGSDTPVKNALKACGNGDSCAEGACEALFLCVDPEEPTTGGGGSSGASSGASGGSEETGGTGGKGGCSCRSGGDTAPFMALVLGLVARRRRR